MLRALIISVYRKRARTEAVTVAFPRKNLPLPTKECTESVFFENFMGRGKVPAFRVCVSSRVAVLAKM